MLIFNLTYSSSNVFIWTYFCRFYRNLVCFKKIFKITNIIFWPRPIDRAVDRVCHKQIACARDRPLGSWVGWSISQLQSRKICSGRLTRLLIAGSMARYLAAGSRLGGQSHCCQKQQFAYNNYILNFWFLFLFQTVISYFIWI